MCCVAVHFILKYHMSFSFDESGSKRDGVWVTWTYNQYYEDVKKAAKGFIKVWGSFSSVQSEWRVFLTAFNTIQMICIYDRYICFLNNILEID